MPRFYYQARLFYQSKSPTFSSPKHLQRLDNRVPFSHPRPPFKFKMELPILHLKVPSVGPDAAGLVALADLTVVQERAALTGTSTLLDMFILTPGMHLQQRAIDVILAKNSGEQPQCAALKTGHVFRIENSALVYYLRKVGRTGCLTRVHVAPERSAGISSLFIPPATNWISGHPYLAVVLWEIAVLVLLVLSQDWWGVAVVGILIVSRLVNIIVMWQRTGPTWRGSEEDYDNGDLLIILS
ncbi:hypothetical protein EYR41_006897 [Orbilia oligospora]|uniref:Uncharacterized protein n=1 Tax=Orbilia oligospora TaxID=2813651 RepID=A0A8H2DZF4_ORBOL|nr:hypothetical protein EYR41_006897 [Orbilia oligospora]